MLTLEAYRAALARDAPAFGEVVASRPDAPVPWCPGWTVADVALHLGGVHRWAAGIVECGELLDDVEGEGDPVAWYAGGWPALLETFDRTDPDDACWGMGPPPRTAAFWWRRQAHETAMHLWDVRTAAGLPATVEDELAADGVDEALTMFAPRMFRLGRATPPSPAIAFATGGRSWVVGDGDPAATVSADPLDLLLLIWKRRDVDGLDVTGDHTALQAALATPFVP